MQPDKWYFQPFWRIIIGAFVFFCTIWSAPAILHFLVEPLMGKWTHFPAQLTLVLLTIIFIVSSGAYCLSGIVKFFDSD